MRLALAQLDAVVGDLAGNRALIVDAIREARSAGADLVVFPELAVTGYPPEDLLLRPGFVKAARASLDEIAPATEGITALVGCPLFDRDLANACAVLSDGDAARGLPQALPAELRRLRRAPLLRRRTRARAAPLRRRPGRADDLRGHLAAGAAGDGPLPRRRAADRQPLRLAVPRRQGRGPRGDARHACARQRVLPRLLQPRRRPGRARLRRALRRARRRGRGDRAGARLRGGAARRRPRPDRGDRPPAARRAAARARAQPRGGTRGDGDRRAAATAGRRSLPPPASCPSRRSSSRCGSRSASASATT